MTVTGSRNTSTMRVQVAGRTTHIRFHIQQVYVSTRPSLATATPHWVPPVDLYETDAEIVLEVDLAGVASNEIRVKFTPRSIILSGFRRDRAEPSATEFHVIEIERGQFLREVELPVPIEVDSARADYHEGLLVVRACKRPSAIHGCRKAQNREGLE